MHNESGTRRNMLKGYMFETIVKQMLQQNGFSVVDTFDGTRIRQQRQHFIELRGRGTWHQIDCPCDYKTFIPFIYPIRLLGEVKFHTKPIYKQHIQELIGVIKDIQENHFVPDTYNGPFQRFTEVGVFFSANGFEEEAEKLAFAHNIKSVSYKNNFLIQPIKETIEEIEKNYLFARECISEGNVADFISSLKEILNDEDANFNAFKERFHPAEGFELRLRQLRHYLNEVRSNFIANTSGGVFIHFVGENAFPEELFTETDEQNTRVFIRKTALGDAYYLEFENDENKRKFYFTPPLSLQQAVYYGTRCDVLNQKEILFQTLHSTMKLGGVTRNLIFNLATDWLNAQRLQSE